MKRGTTGLQDEWISASSALSLLGVGPARGVREICTQAATGRIVALASRLSYSEGRTDRNRIVPPEFWWAKGGSGLLQNWETGDFETLIRQDFRVRAFGVKFRVDDIRELQVAIAKTTVFLGHGRSHDWIEVSRFVTDRLNLQYDEFNRLSPVGIPVTARLEQMLASASFAFAIMTAEDEQIDGSLRARENVVHEAGLFQGKLGFGKAVIMLEEGCQEFSNIFGLGQIRFPAGGIKSTFEEIRRVLEREGIIFPQK